MRSTLFFSALTTFVIVTLTSCTTSDSCEHMICLHDGVCIDGTCDCPERFTGPNCQEQKLPDRIRLRAVTVTHFPALSGDVQWDGTSGPDIFFRLYDEEGPLAQPLTLIENADPGTHHTFAINTLDIFNITDVYTLKLLDYEGVGILSQDMGEVQFQLYQSDNGFPAQIVVDDGGPLSFILEVEYVYMNASMKAG